jgi:general secretion pathway protein I
MMKRRNAGAQGFTLIEVLVAVAVVALAVTALLAAMMRQVDGSTHLRNKMIAQWVAVNQLELALLANAASNRLPKDIETGSVEMAGQSWYWRAEPKRTKEKGFVQLAITVSDSDEDKAPALATLTAVLDAAHGVP